MLHLFVSKYITIYMHIASIRQQQLTIAVYKFYRAQTSVWWWSWAVENALQINSTYGADASGKSGMHHKSVQGEEITP